MNNLFNQSKPASEYPKDWYVIPTMEVIEIIKDLKSEWRKKVMKMKILSGQVAVFELERLIDKLSQHIVTEGDGNSSTIGTHANRPADVNKGCNKDITYKYHTENNNETKTGIIGKCGDLKQFPNKDWKERMYCKECKKAVEQ